MIWMLPITALLIIGLRVTFPEAQRAFRSSLILLMAGLILQFQNCGNGGSSASTSTITYQGTFCELQTAADDPNCVPSPMIDPPQCDLASGWPCTGPEFQ